MEIASSHSAILQVLFFHVNLEAFVAANQLRLAANQLNPF